PPLASNAIIRNVEYSPQHLTGTSARLIADRRSCSIAGFIDLVHVNVVYRKRPNLLEHNLLLQVGNRMC
ncbi:MAG: hypothetical protein ABSG67_22200, partial [Thermoguttaceae bacterium]